MAASTGARSAQAVAAAFVCVLEARGSAPRALRRGDGSSAPPDLRGHCSFRPRLAVASSAAAAMHRFLNRACRARSRTRGRLWPRPGRVLARLALAIVDLGQVAVVRPARELDVLDRVVATVAVRVTMVELEPAPRTGARARRRTDTGRHRASRLRAGLLTESAAIAGECRSPPPSFGAWSCVRCAAPPAAAASRRLLLRSPRRGSRRLEGSASTPAGARASRAARHWP
jgi:hypothetical protein